MTTQEAEEYLKWYADKAAEYHYLARFSTTNPFPVDYPDAGKKKIQALIVLGKWEYLRPYEQVARVKRGLTLKKYNQIREKHGVS